MPLLAPRGRRPSKTPRPDGRTLGVRRYKRLLRELAAEIGPGPLSASEEALLGQAAALIVKSEALQVDIVMGKATDTDMAIRLVSESRRILEALKARSTKAKPAPATSLHELLAREAPAT